jgi:hypothetical protein
MGLAAPAAPAGVDKAKLIEDVRQALYCSKICSYAQGMNIIRAKSDEKAWGVDLGGLARIWKGGCIIRAQFLDLIKQAYRRDPKLPNLLVRGGRARYGHFAPAFPHPGVLPPQQTAQAHVLTHSSFTHSPASARPPTTARSTRRLPRTWPPAPRPGAASWRWR